MGVRLLGRAMLGQTVVAAIIYGFVGTDKSNALDHFAKWASVRSEITGLGNFRPDQSPFGKVVKVVRLIRSHKEKDSNVHFVRVQREIRVFIKTDSGCPRVAFFFSIHDGNHGNSLRINTHLSAPPVSALFCLWF